MALTNYWATMGEVQRKALINQLYAHAYNKIEGWDQKNGESKFSGATSKASIQRTTHSKTMHSQISIRDRALANERSLNQSQIDSEVKEFVKIYVEKI